MMVISRPVESTKCAFSMNSKKATLPASGPTRAFWRWIWGTDSVHNEQMGSLALSARDGVPPREVVLPHSHLPREVAVRALHAFLGTLMRPEGRR